jgi:hypothetical protein
MTSTSPGSAPGSSATGAPNSAGWCSQIPRATSFCVEISAAELRDAQAAVAAT